MFQKRADATLKQSKLHTTYDKPLTHLHHRACDKQFFK